MKENVEFIIEKYISLGVRYGFALPRYQSRAVRRDDVKTAIVFIFSYPMLTQSTNISNYARVLDYHIVVKSLLDEIVCELENAFSENKFRGYVDASPFNEVAMAAAAGLGVIGKNNLLISKEFGSYLFIGEIVCDMIFECSDKTEYCIGCMRCHKSCFGALGDHFEEDRCLSSFSQKKGELMTEQKEILKRSGMAYGCDNCQIACPLNLDKTDEIYKPFTKDIFGWLTKENISLSKDRAFFWRGDKPLLRNLDILEDENED